MKSQKYLNGVLTVIAVCLVLLTLSVIGVIPKASASAPTKFATVPVNPDGSINVRIEPGSPTKVDIEMVAGVAVAPENKLSNRTYPLPVKMVP